MSYKPKRHVPDGYLTMGQVKDLAAPLIADGWKIGRGAFSFLQLEKGDMCLDFRYEYVRYSYQRDAEEDEIMHKTTQVRMSFRAHDIRDVAKWTSYKKFSKKWVDDTFLELSKLLDEDKQLSQKKKTHRELIEEVSNRATALNKELELPYATVEADRNHTEGDTRRFLMEIDNLTEEQVARIAVLMKEFKS